MFDIPDVPSVLRHFGTYLAFNSNVSVRGMIHSVIHTIKLKIKIKLRIKGILRILTTKFLVRIGFEAEGYLRAHQNLHGSKLMQAA